MNQPSASSIEIAWQSWRNTLHALRQKPLLLLLTCSVTWSILVGAKYWLLSHEEPSRTFLDGLMSAYGWLYAAMALCIILVHTPLMISIFRLIILDQPYTSFLTRYMLSFTLWVMLSSVLLLLTIYLATLLSRPAFQPFGALFWGVTLVLPFCVIFALPAVAIDAPWKGVSHRLNEGLGQWERNILVFALSSILFACPVAIFFITGRWLLTFLELVGMEDAALLRSFDTTAIVILLAVTLATVLLSTIYRMISVHFVEAEEVERASANLRHSDEESRR